MVCLAATGVLLMTLAAAKVLRGSSIVLPAALTSGFILFGGLDATHHWFSGLIALIAMLVLFNGSQNWRIVLAGALCGIVASFTQSKGATVTAEASPIPIFSGSGSTKNKNLVCPGAEPRFSAEPHCSPSSSSTAHTSPPSGSRNGSSGSSSSPSVTTQPLVPFPLDDFRTRPASSAGSTSPSSI